jgi:hypothetical protein
VKSLEVAVYQHTRINILIHLQFMNILWTYFWQFKTCNFFTCCEIRGGYFFFRYPNDWVEQKASLKPPSFTRTSNMAAWTFHH